VRTAEVRGTFALRAMIEVWTPHQVRGSGMGDEWQIAGGTAEVRGTVALRSMIEVWAPHQVRGIGIGDEWQIARERRR